VLLVLGHVCARMKYLTRAEALADRALELGPDDGEALGLRGRARLEARRLDLARQDLEQSLRLGEGLFYAPEVRLLLAACLLDLGRLEEALGHFRRCRDEQPSNPWAHYGAGRCLRLLGRLDEAAQSAEEAVRLRP